MYQHDTDVVVVMLWNPSLTDERRANNNREGPEGIGRRPLDASVEINHTLRNPGSGRANDDKASCRPGLPTFDPLDP